MKISFSKLNINEKELLVVKNIIKSGWLTHGKYTQMFENEMKKFTKTKYAVSVSSCTAALHLSCLALGFKPKDEVIVPAQTHTATAHAVRYTGAKVVFADVDLYSGNINIESFKKKITKKTKGLILVHMAGYPCEMNEILKLCKKKNITIIEDCAHALGTFYKNKHVGNFGISGCFSFYPTKQITTGEGGMLVTNNKNFYEKVKRLKAFGIDTDIKDRKIPGAYDVKMLGYNYRMTDFQAALGFMQLKNYRLNLRLRKSNAKEYIKNLKYGKNIKFCKFLKENSYFVFQVFCEDRNNLIKFLKKKGIGTSIHYHTPLPKMSYYKKNCNYNIKDYANSIEYGKTNISLPVYPKLSKKEIRYICKCLKNYFE